jgi:CheY-like chemotaxis protein
VLVVDDDEELRETAAAALERLGLRVLQAASGPDALQVLAGDGDIGLIFTDVRMPGMSGVELARHALAMRPSLQVVVTSADSGAAGRAVKDAAFLAKPYRIDDLERTVTRRLAGPATADRRNGK